MPRTAATSTSARSAVLAWSLVVTVGLAALRASCPSGTPSVPVALAIPATPAACCSDEDIIEFELDAAGRAANYLIVIGSLGDAAEVSTIQWTSLAAAQSSRDIPLNRTPGKSTGSPPSTLSQAVKSAGALQDVAELNAVPTQRRLFFLQLGTDPSAETSYQPVESRLVACSARVSLWQDLADQHGKTGEDVRWMATCLEQAILPRISGLYGEIADLDGDGTLAVCLTRRLAELPATGVPVEGLVQFNDFQPELGRPFGNQADVMFVSADLVSGPHATAILAHETAHLAVFSRRREADPRQFEPEDDWLNEGLAHYAEVVCSGDWSNLAPRIAAFQQDSGLSALVVSDAARQGLWRDPGARGAAWTFLSWLAQEYDEDVLMQIASQSGTGCEKIERITGQPFEELFRQWTVALCSPSSPVLATHPKQAPHRSRKLSTIAIDARKAGETIPLRGSGHVGYHVTVNRGERRRVRIAAPKQARVQVTVVERDTAGSQYWPVR